MSEGETRLKKNHNSILQETKGENMKMKQDGVCISMVPASDFSVTLAVCVWVFLLKLLDSAVTIK